MGYAMPAQTSHGIHFRQYSRAFIFADAEKKNRVVFVNIDICMGSQAIKIEVGGVTCVCVSLSLSLSLSLCVCVCVCGVCMHAFNVDGYG